MIIYILDPPPVPPNSAMLWLWMAAGAVAGGALLVKYVFTRTRAAVVAVKPLKIDQLVAIIYPEKIPHDKGFPNVETLMKPQPGVPTEKVPHVPAVCRMCEVLDALPEDGVRPTEMHWSGLCMQCYKGTPEGQAALASGAIV